MRELTIAQCKELEKGEPIPSFRGRITKVYEQKSGVGQYGEWTMQNMIVEDSTGHVQVTWGGPDDLSDLEGEIRLFESSLSDKHGLTGIKWDVRTSNGKTYSGIKLTESCKIKSVEGGQKQHDREDADPYGQHGETDIPPNLPLRPSGTNGLQETREHLMRTANLHVLCTKAVNNVIAGAIPPIAQTAEFFQAAVASLFIEASSRRTTDGVNWWSYVDKMPCKPILEPKPQSQEDDEPPF